MKKQRTRQKTVQLATKIGTTLKLYPNASNAQIAQELGLAVGTVAPWAAKFRKKFGIVAERGRRVAPLHPTTAIEYLEKAIELLKSMEKEGSQ
jgi:predicted transcriptional regulator